MDSEQLNILDGSREERERIMKDFFGLTSDQSFQELEVDVEDDEE